MVRFIPLHGYSISFVCAGGVDTGGNLVSVDVAGYVVGCYVCDGGIGGGHADGGLVAGGDAVDPDLVQVLVGGDGAEEGGGDEGFGDHFDGWVDLNALWDVTSRVGNLWREMNVVDHRSHLEKNVYRKLEKKRVKRTKMTCLKRREKEKKGKLPLP